MLNPKKITAEGIMNSDLLTFREDTSVKEAIATMEDYHISGVPVVNASEECVGVFSSTDVLKRRVEIEEGESPRSGDYFSREFESKVEDAEEYFSKEDYDEKLLGEDTVGQWMTTDVQSVSPDATVEEVCKRMLDKRVHRILVMEGKNLRGIISSFDVVRLVAGRQARKPAKKKGK